MNILGVILFMAGCLIVLVKLLESFTEWRGDTRRHTRRWKK